MTTIDRSAAGIEPGDTTPRDCNAHAMIAVWVCRKCGWQKAPHQPDGPHTHPLSAYQDGPEGLDLASEALRAE